MRVSSANRAFYCLQSAGLHKGCVAPSTGLHMYSTLVRSALLYGCQSIHMTNKDLIKLDKIQAKYIKTFLGLSHFCHTKPLLKAIGIKPISESISVSSLELFRAHVRSSSASFDFYSDLLKFNKIRTINKSVLARAHKYCISKNINLFHYMSNNKYRQTMKKHVTAPMSNSTDGVVDSIRLLLNNYSPFNCFLLNLLLKTF